jgi:hypothetical protein
MAGRRLNVLRAVTGRGRSGPSISAGQRSSDGAVHALLRQIQQLLDVLLTLAPGRLDRLEESSVARRFASAPESEPLLRSPFADLEHTGCQFERNAFANQVAEGVLELIRQRCWRHGESLRSMGPAVGPYGTENCGSERSTEVGALIR